MLLLAILGYYKLFHLKLFLYIFVKLFHYNIIKINLFTIVNYNSELC
jgi:hypothetical protein